MSTPTNYRQRLLELLQTHPAFATLSEAEALEFATFAQIGYGEPNLEVITMGATAETFFMVLSGQLRALASDQCLHYYRVGEMAGMRAWLDQQPHAVQIEVAVAAYVAVFTETAWQWLSEKHPEILPRLRQIETQREQTAQLTCAGHQADEVVLRVSRAHPMSLLPALGRALLWLVVPTLIWALADVLIKTMFAPLVTNSWLIVMTTVPFITMSLFAVGYHYWQWRQQSFILTTKRVIRQEWQWLGGITRQIVPLTYVQGVTLQQESWLGHFIGYHQVELTTLGGGLLHWQDLPQAIALKNQVEQELPLAHDRLQTVIKQTSDHAQQLHEVIQAQGIPLSQAVKPSPWPTWLRHWWPQLREIQPYTTHESSVKWRTHYGVWLKQVARPLLSGLIFVLLWGFTLAGWLPLATTTLQICWGLGLLLSVVWYGWRYDGWRRQVYGVTPSGVRQSGAELSFDQIEQITCELPTDYRQWLNVGTVIIKPTGHLPNMTWSHLFNPMAVQQELFNRFMLYQQRQRLMEVEADKKIIDISPHLAKKNRPQPSDVRMAA